MMGGRLGKFRGELAPSTPLTPSMLPSSPYPGHTPDVPSPRMAPPETLAPGPLSQTTT